MLATGQARSKFRYPGSLGLHFDQVAPSVLVLTDRWAVLSIEVGVQLFTWSELTPPFVPGLIGLAHAAGSIPTHEDACSVVWILGIVPAPRPNRSELAGHSTSMRAVAGFVPSRPRRGGT